MSVLRGKNSSALAPRPLMLLPIGGRSLALAALVTPTSTMDTPALSSLRTGLVGYWALDDASGSAVADKTLINNGAWGGTVSGQWGTGLLGGCGVFNGTDYVRVTAATGLPDFATNVWTVAFWITVASLPSGSGVPRLFYWGTDNTANFVQCGLGGSTSSWPGDIVVHGKQVGNAASARANVTLATAAWQHVIVTANGTTVTLYVNNSTASTAASAIALGLSTSYANFYFGGVTSVAFLTGSMDEVGLWSRVLTALERTTLYNGGAGRAYPWV